MNKLKKDPFQYFPNYYNKNNKCEEPLSNKKITIENGGGQTYRTVAVDAKA